MQTKKLWCLLSIRASLKLAVSGPCVCSLQCDKVLVDRSFLFLFTRKQDNRKHWDTNAATHAFKTAWGGIVFFFFFSYKLWQVDKAAHIQKYLLLFFFCVVVDGAYMYTHCTLSHKCQVLIHIVIHVFSCCFLKWTTKASWSLKCCLALQTPIYFPRWHFSLGLHFLQRPLNTFQNQP